MGTWMSNRDLKHQVQRAGMKQGPVLGSVAAAHRHPAGLPGDRQVPEVSELHRAGMLR